jgi:hypothetical protein
MAWDRHKDHLIGYPKKHNVGFKPFNDCNCQMNTNAGKANSLINHVQFWIEMFKKDFVT